MKFFELYDFAKSKCIILESTLDSSTLDASTIDKALESLDKIKNFLGIDTLRVSGVLETAMKLSLYAGQGGQHVAKRDLLNFAGSIPTIAILCTFFEDQSIKAAMSAANIPAEKVPTNIKVMLYKSQEDIKNSINGASSSGATTGDVKLGDCVRIFVDRFKNWSESEKGKALCHGFGENSEDTQQFLEKNRSYISYRLLQKLSEQEVENVNKSFLLELKPFDAIAHAIALGMNDIKNQEPQKTYKDMLAVLVTGAATKQLVFNDGMGSTNSLLGTANAGGSNIHVPWFGDIVRNINSDEAEYKQKITTLESLSNKLVNLAYALFNDWTTYIQQLYASTEPKEKDIAIWGNSKTRAELTGHIYIHILIGDLNLNLEGTSGDPATLGPIFAALQATVAEAIMKIDLKNRNRKHEVTTLKTLENLCSSLNNNAIVELYNSIESDIMALAVGPSDPSYMNVMKGVTGALGRAAAALKGL